jgi:hypothetical protein
MPQNHHEHGTEQLRHTRFLRAHGRRLQLNRKIPADNEQDTKTY